MPQPNWALDLDLSQNLVDQYFGPWAVEPERFNAMVVRDFAGVWDELVRIFKGNEIVRSRDHSGLLHARPGIRHGWKDARRFQVDFTLRIRAQRDIFCGIAALTIRRLLFETQ